MTEPSSAAGAPSSKKLPKLAPLGGAPVVSPFASAATAPAPEHSNNSSSSKGASDRQGSTSSVAAAKGVAATPAPQQPPQGSVAPPAAATADTQQQPQPKKTRQRVSRSSSTSPTSSTGGAAPAAATAAAAGANAGTPGGANSASTKAALVGSSSSVADGTGQQQEVVQKPRARTGNKQTTGSATSQDASSSSSGPQSHTEVGPAGNTAAEVANTSSSNGSSSSSSGSIGGEAQPGTPPDPAAAAAAAEPEAGLPIPTGLKPIKTRGGAGAAAAVAAPGLAAEHQAASQAPEAAAAAAAGEEQQHSGDTQQQQQQQQQQQPVVSAIAAAAASAAAQGQPGASGDGTLRSDEATLMSPRYARGIPCSRTRLTATGGATGWFASAAGDTLRNQGGTAATTSGTTGAGGTLSSGTTGALGGSQRMVVVKVMRTGMLQPDVMLTRPVVRLHVVSADTGEYLCLPQQLLGGHSTTEAAAESSSSGGLRLGGSRRSAAGGKEQVLVPPEAQSELLAYPGRPTLTTVKTPEGGASSALLQYVPPVQTCPVDLTTRSSVPGLLGVWCEELAVDVPPEVLLQEQALLLLEVLQLPESFTEWKKHSSRYAAGAAYPAYRVAWAFFRAGGLSGPEFKPLDVKLQLYQYPPERSSLSEKGGSNAAAVAFQAWKALHMGPSSSSSSSPAPGTSSAGPGAGQEVSSDGSPSHPWSTSGQTPSSPLRGSSGTSGSSKTANSSSSSKYPSTLQVVLTQRPRPAELTVSDPAKGIRPALPAGYGSGFEIGRYPVALLSSGGPRGTLTPRGHSHVTGSASMVPLEQQTSRPHTTPCQVPNVTGVTLKGTSGGTSAMAWSHDGRWLAVAAADAGGGTRVCVYHALAGELYATLGTHHSLVYSLRWSKDDCAIVTASADLTAKVWHMPNGPAVASAAVMVNTGKLTATGLTSSSTTCTVLQHTCYVYAAEFLPQQQQSQPVHRTVANRKHKAAAAAGVGEGGDTSGESDAVPGLATSAPTAAAAPGSCLVLTAGYDGALRLLDGHTGALLWAVRAHRKPITTLALDPLGTRLYSGDLSGCLQEYAVDLGQLHLGLDSPVSKNASALKADDLPLMRTWRPQRPGTLLSPSDAAVTPDDAADATATLRPPSPHRLQAPGSALFEPLRKLRSSWELKGRPVSWLGVHPGGHHLVVQTRSSDLVAMDCKLLLVARRYQPLKAGSSCVQPALSPDGQLIVAGSDNGAVTAWDFATATPTHLPHLALGGSAVHCVAWSYSFHAVAACSFSHYTPVKISCYTPARPMVLLTPPPPDAVKAAAAAAAADQLAAANTKRALNARSRREEIPTRLTPELVHRMLHQLRSSAQERGVYQGPADPSGRHLVVPAAQALREPSTHPGDTSGDRAYAASDVGSLRNSGYSSGSARRPLGSRKAAAAVDSGGSVGLAAGGLGGEEVVAEGGDGVLVL